MRVVFEADPLSVDGTMIRDPKPRPPQLQPTAARKRVTPAADITASALPAADAALCEPNSTGAAGRNAFVLHGDHIRGGTPMPAAADDSGHEMDFDGMESTPLPRTAVRTAYRRRIAAGGAQLSE
jgi:hypothetical protein